MAKHDIFCLRYERLSARPRSVLGLDDQPQLTRCFVASNTSGGRAGSAPRGPRSHEKPLRLLLVQCCSGLAGCYFEHCRSASTALGADLTRPSCRDVARKTGSELGRRAELEHPFADADLRDGKSSLALERRRLGLQGGMAVGQWECGGNVCPEYAYWTRFYWGHITISMTSTLGGLPCFPPLLLCSSPALSGKHCRVPGNMAGSAAVSRCHAHQAETRVY